MKGNYIYQELSVRNSLLYFILMTIPIFKDNNNKFTNKNNVLVYNVYEEHKLMAQHKLNLFNYISI